MDQLPQGLAESLAAAWLDRANIHNLLCGQSCTCGIGSLLTELVTALLPGFVEAAGRLGLEGRPFWPSDYPELFQATAASPA